MVKYILLNVEQKISRVGIYRTEMSFIAVMISRSYGIRNRKKSCSCSQWGICTKIPIDRLRNF